MEVKGSNMSAATGFPPGVSGNNSQQSTVDMKLEEVKFQTDEVVQLMRNNVEKVLERSEQLSRLDERASYLEQGASEFEIRAVRLKRKYWWKNWKMILLMSMIGVIVLTIIIIWATNGFGS